MPEDDFFLDKDKIIANAVRYLIQGNEMYEASILLLCDLEISVYNQYYDNIELQVVLITDNRTIYSMFSEETNSTVSSMEIALNAAVPRGMPIANFICEMHFTDLEGNWRNTLMEVIEGKRSLNQCKPIEEKPRYPWENLYFRSPVEIIIAGAFDKYKVLFLPNCMARLGLPGSRKNKEADFLVCFDGKWGILEINGETYHPSAANDHERTRLFKLHGIRVFELYDAKRCMKEPDIVVKEFLTLLRSNA